MGRNNKYISYTKAACQEIAVVLLLILLATVLSFIIRHFGFTEVNVVIVYILSVLLASRYTRGLIYGIFTSFIATLSYNFFFTEPVYTFSVYDKSYLFTFFIMLVAAIFVSTITSSLISAKEKASAQEKQAHTLYEITSSLAKTRGFKEVIIVSMQCLSNLLDSEIACVVTGEGEQVEEIIKLQSGSEICSFNTVEKDQLINFKAQYYVKPVKVQDSIGCVFYLPKKMEKMSEENQYLFESVFMQIAIALEREHITRKIETAKIETEQERFKSNLLRSISHDLRTPLSVITGAADMLLHSLENSEDRNIAAGIYEDSIWLTRMVENILSLTRIQEGSHKVAAQLEAVEEIIAESIRRVHKYAPDHRISATIPDEVLFVYMDSGLIVQVLINLLDNAVKHTSPEGEINITVTPDEGKVWFIVSDNGNGIDEGNLDRLFDTFYLTGNQKADAKRGMGLGLAICKAIVKMHGGEIYAENNRAGGASFRFYLSR